MALDDAQRARLLACLDDMLELVEADMRADDDRWARLIDTIAARQDGSLQTVVRLLSQYASLATLGLAGLTNTHPEQALTDARLGLMQWIEEQA